MRGRAQCRQHRATSRRNPAVRRRPAGGSPDAAVQDFHGGYAGRHPALYGFLFLRLKLRLTVYHNGFTGSASTSIAKTGAGCVLRYYDGFSHHTTEQNDEIPPRHPVGQDSRFYLPVS